MAEYIDKQAAIDEIEEWYELYPDSDAAREALSQVKRAIKKLPPADVRENVPGRWIHEEWYDLPRGFPIPYFCVATCTVCGFTGSVSVRCGKDQWENASDFCPHCGADMREAKSI